MVNKNVAFFGSGGIAPMNRPLDSNDQVPIWTLEGRWGMMPSSAIGGGVSRTASSFGCDARGDVTVPINRALAYSAANKVPIYFTPGHTYLCGNITFPSGAVIVGSQGFRSPQAVLQWNGVGTGILKSSVAQLQSLISGFEFVGLGAATPGKGLNFSSFTSGEISNCQFNTWADEGMVIGGGVASKFLAIGIRSCVLNTTRVAKTGSIDINGTDHWIQDLECGTSAGTRYSVNLYCVAIIIRGANHFVRDCIGETSEVGFYITCILARFVSCRADLNFGNGFEVAGNDNVFVACVGYNNSRFANNTYDQFVVSGINNNLVGCRGQGQTYFPRYSFYDTLASGTQKNAYVGCYSVGQQTSTYKMADPLGSSVTPLSGTNKTLAASATPSVDNYCNFTTGNAVPTAITFFTNGVEGQIINIFCNDANTSVQYTAATGGIQPPQGQVTFTLENGHNYQFLLRNGQWYLLGYDYSYGTLAYDPPSMPSLTNAVAGPIAVPGAAVGDMVDVSFSQPLTGGVALTAFASAAGQCYAIFFNPTAGAIDLPAGTLTIQARKAS